MKEYATKEDLNDVITIFQNDEIYDEIKKKRFDSE